MIAAINITTWEGLNLNLLSYSSLYLIIPPPLEGRLMPVFAIRFKIGSCLKMLLWQVNMILKLQNKK
jgi:hypothetical protein